MKPWNPMLMKPSTPSTRAANVSGRFLLKTATAIDHAESESAHNSSEPSCAPHTAEKR